MHYPVTIEFDLPGTQPPVYIATNLSKPQWRPVEMDSTQDEHGQYRFSMTFEAEPGPYQYKLRLGPGDWWICDDSVPKVTDDDGNENNEIVVEPDSRKVDESTSEHTTAERQDSVHLAPLMPHEKPADTHQHHLAHEPSRENGIHPHMHSPLLQHESLAPIAPSEENSNRDADGDDDEVLEGSPLLRHESFAPSSQEQEQSPLFRHESIAIDNQQHHDDASGHSSSQLSSRKHSYDSVPEEADPNDPSLERFPTDHRGILEHLDRTRRSMTEDETSEGHGSSPRRQSPTGSFVASASPSLPSVTEDDGELENETSGKSEEIDSIADAPQVIISELQERPFAPMTPPMTPKDEHETEQPSQLDDAISAISDNPPAKVKEKAHELKEKVHQKAREAGHSSLPALAVGLAVAMAVASAALAIWYIKTKNDNVVL